MGRGPWTMIARGASSGASSRATAARSSTAVTQSRARSRAVSPRTRRRVITFAVQAEAQYAVHFEDFVVETVNGIALYDITPQVNQVMANSGIVSGTANVISRHTTTALTINECEPRLMDDVRQFLAKLVPASYPYLHNDLQYRDIPVPFVGKWPDDEPINAHSHILGMLLGQVRLAALADASSSPLPFLPY